MPPSLAIVPCAKDQVIRAELHEVRREIVVESRESSYPPDVRQVLAYLGRHVFDEACNVNAVVDGAGVVESDIGARFGYHMKVTLHRYIEERRMQAARCLLYYDFLKIGEIAFSVGYANYRTFARAFERNAWCNPTTYRDKIAESTLA